MSQNDVHLFSLAGRASRVARFPVSRVPVRDDVLDTHPHGTIASMHDGLGHSCNAYFAQLALRVGPEAILEVAGRLGISVAPSNSVQRLRATLPAGRDTVRAMSWPLR